MVHHQCKVLRLAGFRFLGTAFVIFFLVATINFQPLAVAKARGNSGAALTAPLFVPLPAVTVSTGSVMLGSDFTINATFANNGDTGYGPFIDLYIPHLGPDGVYSDPLTYDGVSPSSGTDYTATMNGESVTVVTKTFPDADGAGPGTTGCVSHPWALDATGFFLQVCGTAGDQLVSVLIPYGSYTPGQPPISISVPAHLSANANLGQNLSVRARAGFIYGRTPMVDWCCTSPVDTTIVSDSGTPDTWSPFSNVVPSVVNFSKSTTNNEVATGPNNPATYTLTVNTAPGQSFTNIHITDDLPNSIVYLGNLQSNVPYTSISQPVVDGLPHNGQQIVLTYADELPTPTPVSGNIVVSFDYYIPEFDADGNLIAPGGTTNTATLDGITWIPADGSTPVVIDPADIGPGVTISSDKPLVLGKGSSIAVNTGAAGATPGDILSYSMTFEISDYFGFANLNLADILSDGQHYYTDAGHNPTLRVVRDGGTENYAFDPANVGVTCNYTGGPGLECDLDDAAVNDGRTSIVFDIAQELRDQTNPDNDQVLGDRIADGGLFANQTTSVTVVFYAVIEDHYTDLYPGESVKGGDTLADIATIQGDQVDSSTCNPGPCTVTATVRSDAASAGVSIGRGVLEKTIVARNGTVCNLATFDPCANVQVSAGDSITYRIKYNLVTGDFLDLSLTDFLPLPIFYADDPSVDGSSLSTWPQYAGAADVPDSGTWMLSPFDTRGINPVGVAISGHTADNSVKFDFGSFDDLLNQPKTIDILFTVKVTSQKFGDGLKMRNSVLQQDANSPGTISTEDKYIDLTLTEPALVGEKTVVSTDHAGVDPNPAIPAPIVFNLPGDPSSPPWDIVNPINSDYLDANVLGSGINGIDGSDMVKFAIVIENQGSGINGAFDITLKDILPSGYIFPGVGLGGFNLQVYRGDGKALDDGTGSGFEFVGTVANPGPDGTPGTPDDFFGAGVRLRDPADNPAFVPSDPEYGQGLCQLHELASGRNVIIVTYDLMVRPDIEPGQLLQNQGEVTNYSGSEGGDNYVDEPIQSGSDSTIINPVLQKQLTTTEVGGPGNDHTQAVIGEFLTYTLTATFPEGTTPTANIVDALDTGLAFVDLLSITASNPDTDSAGAADTGIYSSVMTFDNTGACTNCTVGTDSAAGNNPLIENNGGRITFDFGTLSNTDSDNAVAETVTIVYRVLVLNISTNQSVAAPLNNAATLSWAGGSDTQSANTVSIVEPNVNVTKAVDITSGVDAGNELTYTIVISNPGALPAFDVTLTDAFPYNAAASTSLLENIVINSVVDTDIVTPVTAANFAIVCDDEPACAAPNRWTLNTVAPFDMPQNRTITLTIKANVSLTAFPNTNIDNYAQIRWTSMDGDFSDRSTFIPVIDVSDSERTGSDGPGGLLNDYARQSPVVARTTLSNLAGTKTFIVSSEAGTLDTSTPPRVTIGEVVRYRIALRLNEGTMPDLSMLDRIPAGLRFINDAQARVAFVSDGAGITSSTLNNLLPGCGGLNQSGTAADIISLPTTSITCPLPDTAVSTSRTIFDINNDAYASGTDVYFKMGNVVNADNDASQEFIVVEFNAVVENIFSNQAQNNVTGGVSTLNRSNDFQSFINTSAVTPPASLFTATAVDVRIAEPAITNLTKAVNPANGDAGDQVEYTVTFSNVNSVNASPAYDVVLTDNVPAKMTVLPVDTAADITFTPALCGVFDSDTSSGNTITLTFLSLNSGCAVSVKYRATLQSSVIPGEILTNNAVVNYSSLPLTTGTTPNPTGSDTPGATGAPTGERNGTGGQGADGTILNNYRDLAFVNMSITPIQPVKSLVSSTDPLTLGSNLTVGEAARYRMLLILAEGTSPALQIRDNIPAGLQYLDDGDSRLAFVSDNGIPTCVGSTASVSSSDGAISANPWICGNDTTVAAIVPTFVIPGTAITGGPFAEGTDPTFNLSDVVNSDTDANAEYIVVEFNARVLNVAGNQDTPSTTINNNFTVLINAINKGTSANIPVTVAEPIITLDKQLSSITGAADAGGLANYTVTLTNTGTAPAYESNFIDTLPTVLDFDPASVSVAFAGGASGQIDNSSDLLNQVDVTIGMIPVGGSATITYSGVISISVTPGELIENTGSAVWTSLSGTDVNERDGSGGVDDYSTPSNTAFFSSAPLVPVKSIVSTTAAHTSEAGDGSLGSARDLTIGEVIRYRLAVTIPEGTVPQLQLLDTLPAGFTFLNDGDVRISLLANQDMTEEDDLSGADNDLLPPTFILPSGRIFVSGQDITFVVADLVTANDLVNHDNDADAEYVVIDFNVLVNDDANNNNTDLDNNDFDVIVGGATVATSGAVGTHIVEPLLDITKLVDDASWAYGQTVLYTLRLTHTAASLAAAQDVVITDKIPDGLTYTAGSIVAPAGWAADDSNAPDLTWTCAGVCSMLTTDGILEFTYQVRVDDPPVPPALPGGGTATNTASVTWTTLSGTDANERIYTDSSSVTGTLDEYRYALGNRVWFDTNNNSLIDNDGAGGNPDEVGVNNVRVELYKDDGSGNLVYQNFTTTVNGGYYLFDYLVAGDYVVVIPPTNFDAGEVLDGYYSSATSIDASGIITESAAQDSNTDIDSDDNGLFQTAGGFVGGVSSSPITLGGAEPINELDLNGGSQGVQPDDRANMTVDFGFYRTAIGNLVWLDENADGGYDSGETLVEAADVRLYVSDGTTDVEIQNTTTDVNGAYSFTGLPEGNYLIKVVGPAGTLSTTDALNSADTSAPDTNADNNDNGIDKLGNSVSSGMFLMDAGSAGALSQNSVIQNNGTTTNPTLDFGFVYPYALGNRIWFDTNNDAQIGPSELGVANVTVELYSTSDLTTVVDTDTTNADGYYLFDALFPDEYVVVIPATNLTSGVLTGYWSSETKRAADGSIGEAIAASADNNADSDDNGTLQTSGGFVNAVISSPVILGPFGLVEPSNELDLESGIGQGSQPDGRSNLTVDFGFYRVEVGDLVYSDGNQNGNYESINDVVISGVVVQLFTTDGTNEIEINVGPDGVLGTTDDAPGGMVTDINGLYLFGGLPEGEYIIKAVAPSGTSSTIDTYNVDDDNTDPNVNADDNDNGIGTGSGVVTSGLVTLTPGYIGAPGYNNNAINDGTGTTSNPTLDFGFIPAFSLGNRVWFDTNNSSQISGAEVGIANVDLELYNADASGAITTSTGLTTSTSVDGYYLFNNLPAGNYVVVIPAANFVGGGALYGYWSSGTTRDTDGAIVEAIAALSNTDSDSDDNGMRQASGAFNGAVISSFVTLGPNTNTEPFNELDLAPGGQGQPDRQANMTVDFGFYTIELGNQIWNDLDNNGLFDGLETGIFDVTVELWPSDSSGVLPLETVTTDINGGYTFTGLPRGDYIVRIPNGEFEGAGALRDYVSSTGGALTPYEPAPDTDADFTDSDDNGTEVGGILGLGGYIQTSVISLIPAGEQSVDDSLGLTQEPRVDFGVFSRPVIDLSVTKTDNTDFYITGGVLNYDIVVTNNGPADVIGAVITDAIPLGQISTWTWDCAVGTPAAYNCTSASANSLDFTDLLDLPSGTSVTYNVTATVDATATGDLLNQVTVSLPAGSPITETNIGNNTAQDVDALASLVITKDDGISVVGPASSLTYMITVQNTGDVDLTDITITDSLPADLIYLAANPVPTTIAGNLLTWSGMSLTSGSSTIISVTASVGSSPAGASITNNVNVVDTVTGAENTDSDTDTVISNSQFAKTLITTSETFTQNSEVAIGEIVTYELTANLAAGVAFDNVVITDRMDKGLAFVECSSITLAGTDITSSVCPPVVTDIVDPGDAGNPANPGRQAQFNIGSIPAPAADSTLVIRYTAVVLDIIENQETDVLNNNATWTWLGGSVSASAADVIIVEPDLTIDKSALPTSATAGTAIEFTLTIAHTSQSSATAFDVVVTDILPAGLEYIACTPITYSGLPPTTQPDPCLITGGNLSFVWDSFPLNETATIQFYARYTGAYASLTNNASVAWSSLPLDPGGTPPTPIQLSAFNSNSTERWYDPLDLVNIYSVAASVTINSAPRDDNNSGADLPNVLPATGFAPNVLTALPKQPVDKLYSSTDVWMEIPGIGVNIPIVGVPLVDNDWDVSWLWQQAGWLNGTAFPGWQGNSVLTGHITLPNGKSGPFAELDKLKWGDKIIIHSYGSVYTYEVRENRTITPGNTSVLQHEEEAWVTLLTCKTYNEKANTYASRIAARAVLLKVDKEKSPGSKSNGR